MKKLLFILLALPLLSHSQIKDTVLNERLQKAAASMIKFDKQFKIGTIVQVMGGIVIGAGTVVKTPKSRDAFLIIGGIISFAGFVIHAGSSGHIKDAAIILRGGSLVVPIGKKR